MNKIKTTMVLAIFALSMVTSAASAGVISLSDSHIPATADIGLDFSTSDISFSSSQSDSFSMFNGQTTTIAANEQVQSVTLVSQWGIRSQLTSTNNSFQRGDFDLTIDSTADLWFNGNQIFGESFSATSSSTLRWLETEIAQAQTTLTHSITLTGINAINFVNALNTGNGFNVLATNGFNGYITNSDGRFLTGTFGSQVGTNYKMDLNIVTAKVPEPSSLALLGFALFGLARRSIKT